jgi:protein-disulfide isomerase/uncharacterized membrane protein
MEQMNRYGAFVLAGVAALAGLALGDYAGLAWAAAAVLACLGVTLQSPRWGVFATGLVGAAASAYLFYEKIDASAAAICNIDAKINCSVVNSSAASMIAGLPIAVLGMGFFGGVAVAAATLSPSKTTRLYQPVAAAGAVGVLYSAWLGYQTWLLGAVCFFCLTIYACTALLVLAGVRGAKEEVGALGEGLGELPKSSAWLTIAGVFAVVVLLGQSWWASNAPQDAAALLGGPKPGPGARPAPPPSGADLASAYVSRVDVPLEGDEPVLGNPNGRIQIVEYADFLCPHCAQAFPLMHQLVESNPEIGLRFRAFPLTGECNPVTAPGNHPERCRAAMAAQCATDQGRFWEYAGLLFANQQQMSEELIATAAAQLGLDLPRFSQCLQDPRTLEQVQRDGVSGGQLQLYGTPAFFVKGLTPGGGWAESCSGPLGVIQLLKAVEAGETVPPAAAPTCPRE